MKSYNRADTKVSVKGERVVVESDIKRRMRMVVAAMTTLSGKTGRIVFPWEILRYMQMRDTSYSRTDMLYAMRKCMESNLIQNVGWGAYQLTIDPKIAKTVVR